jgi:DNA transformation protein and related proteins
LDAEFIRELFAQFSPVTIRRMFSGTGLFCDGVMFGLVVRDVVYLKVDDASIPNFEREGSQPFTYTRSNRTGRVALSYWRLPDRLYDDPNELAVWAKRALAIAEGKKLAPRRRVRRKSKNSAG